jgi:hypothetical protein
VVPKSHRPDKKEAIASPIALRLEITRVNPRSRSSTEDEQGPSRRTSLFELADIARSDHRSPGYIPSFGNHIFFNTYVRLLCFQGNLPKEITLTEIATIRTNCVLIPFSTW